MALLKLYRGAVAPTSPVQGMIWFNNVTETVEGVEQVKNVIKVYTGTEWEVYGITDADLQALAARVATLEGDVKTIKDETLPALKAELEKYADDAVATEAAIARKAEEDLGKRIDDLAAAAVSVKEDTINHVKVTKNGTEYTVEGVDIASAQDLADEISRATGEEARIEGLVNTEKGRAEGVEAGLETRLAAVEADYLKAADKTELSDAIAAEKTRAEGKEAELLAAIEAEATTARAAEKANADAIAVEKGRLDAFLSDADVTEKAVDTLKEIQTYINEHGEAAAKMVENIAANAAAIETETTRATTAEGNLQTAITNEIAAREAGDADTLAAAKKYTDDEIAGLNANVTSAEKYTVTTTAEDGTESTEEINHKVRVQVVEENGVITGVNVTESDIASAKTVKEHEIVVSAALNDLNARMTTAEGSVADHEARLTQAESDIDALEGALANKNVDAESTTPDYVTATAADNKVTVAATQKTIEAVALAETSVQEVTSNNSCLTAVKTGNSVALSLVWEEDSF